ncbi:Transposon Ty3-I Gag-Pol polyprotein [Araneus ventricosus]|uniref:Transposon Ty3-I Gag-Pol polyprotein n=1 Tax=Araneus ventricosus TaxID=182803 RepID=A0A4Y2H6F9_ARAVE|nr:Transposon Ty3-I Gag-Pol polyprotein [Araneus ventricosus]
MEGIFPPDCLKRFEQNELADVQNEQINSFSSKIQNKLPFFSAVLDNESFDLTHIFDSSLRGQVQHLVKGYEPAKESKGTDLRLNVVLRDEIPVSQRSRRMPFAEQKIVDKEIDEWLEKGIIKLSCSDYASPILLTKKRDGTHRLCVDFRQLNKKVVKDSFPMAQVEEVLDHLGDAKVFSTLVLKNGFFHVPVEEKCTKYLAFTCHAGLYEFLRTPFGLSTSPSVFLRFIYNVFRDLIRDNAILIFMGDFIIPARDEIQGLEKL